MPAISELVSESNRHSHWDRLKDPFVKKGRGRAGRGGQAEVLKLLVTVVFINICYNTILKTKSPREYRYILTCVHKAK